MQTFSRNQRLGSPYIKQYNEESTAEKFYDIEQSQRKYEILMEENIWLRQKIEKMRKNSQHHNQDEFAEKKRGTIRSGADDMALWTMMERNRYLENKIQKLKSHHQKQSRNIQHIYESDKWKNKDKCTQSTCYQNKYLQLLRIKSPLY